MAHNRKTHAKRILQIEALLKKGWPPQNPDIAYDRWLLIKELAHLKDIPVKEIKKALKEGTL